MHGAGEVATFSRGLPTSKTTVAEPMESRLVLGAVQESKQAMPCLLVSARDRGSIMTSLNFLSCLEGKCGWTFVEATLRKELAAGAHTPWSSFCGR